MRLDMSDALRPGKLFALRWKCCEGDRLELRETVYRGKIRPFGKTKNSMWPVPLGERLAQDLWLWKQECPDAWPEAFIFPNARGGFMNATNYRNRVLKVVAEELGLPKLTFQVIRRSVSTWSLHDRMGTLKDVQGRSAAHPGGNHRRRLRADHSRGSAAYRRSDRCQAHGQSGYRG